jgi:hypothetical protein
MWIQTQEGELLNLDHVEFIRVEENEDDQTFELRAYPVQVGEPDEDLYYLLAWGDDEGTARSSFASVIAAMTGGLGFLDLGGSVR